MLIISIPRYQPKALNQRSKMGKTIMVNFLIVLVLFCIPPLTEKTRIGACGKNPLLT